MKNTDKKKMAELCHRMIEILKSKPDATEISTRELLEEIGIVDVDVEPEFFYLDELFYKESIKAGFIPDNAKHVGRYEGLPFNIPRIYRDRNKLLKQFSEVEEQEVKSEEGDVYYVRKIEETRKYEYESNETFEETETLQLFRVPSGNSTLMYECMDSYKVFSYFVISGNGIIYELFGPDHDNHSKLYYRKHDVGHGTHCCITNNQDKDLVLFVVQY